MMSAYCDWAPGHPWHGPYHDQLYGFPLREEAALFERLVHEIHQAGLNWLMILKRVEGYAEAFEGFDIERVAAYGPEDIERLMADRRIIRNRRKIEATIENARRLSLIKRDYGGFSAWLESHHPLTLENWLALFKCHFVFVGTEIVGEFLMSTGYLPGAHRPDCPIYARIAALNPPWMGAKKPG